MQPIIFFKYEKALQVSEIGKGKMTKKRDAD